MANERGRFFFPGFRRRLFDGNLRNEVSHLADCRLRIFLGRRFNDVPDLLTRRVHRFKLICGHVGVLCQNRVEK